MIANDTDSETAAVQERDSQLADVTALVEWLRVHPEIPLPSGFIYQASIYTWDTKQEAQIMAKAMGSFEKFFDDSYVRLKKKFGGLTLEAVFSRGGICERVVVGTKEIETEEPDPIALAALPKVKVKKSVEIVEWHCPDSLLGAAEGDSTQNV